MNARAPHRLSWLWLLLPLTVFLWTGERGLDFGRHWDEPLRVSSLSNALEHETLLPEAYNYPSVTFWAAFSAVLPEAARGVELRKKQRGAYLARLVAFVESEAFLLRARRIFLWISSLSIIWVFLAVLSWRKRTAEALVAACTLGLSWEVAYHSRWIAPDALLMQFCALALLLLLRALQRPEERRWAVLAAVAAGLATGTKYPGGLLLFPVLGAGWQTMRAARTRPRLAFLFGLVGIFGLTFLFTTPGAVLNPLSFVRDVRFEMRHYRIGHYGFTVEAGWEHFTRIAQYLLVMVPSHSKILSVALSLFVLMGVGAVARESRQAGLLLLGLPLLYVLYMSTQRVFFVRNLLFLVPFFAILAGRGAGWAFDQATSQRGRLAQIVALTCIFLVNAAWLASAAESIRVRSTDASLRELVEYVDQNPARSFLIGPRVDAALGSAGLSLGENATTTPGHEADFVIVLPDELYPVAAWPGWVPGLAERVFGPREVNFECYGTWWEPRILVVERARARELADASLRPGALKLFPDLPRDEAESE